MQSCKMLLEVLELLRRSGVLWERGEVEAVEAILRIYLVCLNRLTRLNGLDWMVKSLLKGECWSVGYLDGYKDAVGHLLDVTYIKGASNRASGSLSGKEREAVKDRFRVRLLKILNWRENFNTDFEELIRVNRGLSVPDPDVRELVVGEVKRVVIPLYTRFYDKYITFKSMLI